MFKKTAQLVRDGFPNGGERGRGRSTEPVALKDSGQCGPFGGGGFFFVVVVVGGVGGWCWWCG